MVSTFHTLANRSLGCIPCLEPGRLRLPRRSSVSNTEYKSAVLSQASHALLASLLAINLHVANPADAKPEHTDYISVQDRTRQRSPLSSKPQNKDVFNEQSTALSISQQVAEVKRLSAEAALATDQNNFQQALEKYTLITHTYPDLAITQYAKIQRALLLYQVGQQSEAVLELEGEEADLRGNSEVHAALAAMFYAESPKQVNRAETQWEIAREFDQRYGDLQWVSKQRRWPPAMQVALANFLELK